MKFALCIALCLLTSLYTARAQTEIPKPTTVSELKEPAQISYSDAIILGVVEGITEYLPISSTGHLILVNGALELDQETPLLDKQGEQILLGKGDSATPMTLSDAANAYAIIIQVGAIAAVFIIYWKRILTILLGILGKDKAGFLLGRNLVVAFLPAAVLGLLLDDWIESKLFGPGPVVAALVVGGILMLLVEKFKKPTTPAEDSDADALAEMTIKSSLTVGFLQCVAMWPGTSRSMMTIVGGYFVGLKPAQAAEFSFLLGLVTLSAASGYKALTLGPSMLKALDIGPILLGIFVATVSAALAVKWLVSYLTRHGLAVFGWYRIALAAVFLLFAR